VQVQHHIGVDGQAQQGLAQAFQRRGGPSAATASRSAPRTRRTFSAASAPSRSITRSSTASVRLAKWRLKFSPLCSSKRPWKPRSTHWPTPNGLAMGTSTTSPRQAAGRLQRVQVVAQVVGHQHAGHFVGMQRALDGHLGPWPGVP
jgi:hypothetical protein